MERTYSHVKSPKSVLNQYSTSTGGRRQDDPPALHAGQGLHQELLQVHPADLLPRAEGGREEGLLHGVY